MQPELDSLAQSALRLTEAMGEFARAGEWEAFFAAHEQRLQVVEQLKLTLATAASPAADRPPAWAATLTEILRVDSETLALLSEAREVLRQRLGDDARDHAVRKAYGDFR